MEGGGGDLTSCDKIRMHKRLKITLKKEREREREKKRTVQSNLQNVGDSPFSSNKRTLKQTAILQESDERKEMTCRFSPRWSASVVSHTFGHVRNRLSK